MTIQTYSYWNHISDIFYRKLKNVSMQNLLAFMLREAQQQMDNEQDFYVSFFLGSPAVVNTTHGAYQVSRENLWACVCLRERERGISSCPYCERGKKIICWKFMPKSSSREVILKLNKASSTKNDLSHNRCFYSSVEEKQGFNTNRLQKTTKLHNSSTLPQD